MSTIFKCKDGNEHDFDSNEKSEYCAKGCGEKWAIYAIKKLGADLKEKDAEIEQLKADLESLKNEIMFSKESLKYSDSDLDQILLSAKHSYQKHNMSIRGQAITEADDIYYHVIGAAKAKQQAEIQQLKSKLEVAKKGLEKIKELSCSCGFSAINGKMQEYKCIACEALKEIEG